MIASSRGNTRDNAWGKASVPIAELPSAGGDGTVIGDDGSVGNAKLAPHPVGSSGDQLVTGSPPRQGIPVDFVPGIL